MQMNITWRKWQLASDGSYRPAPPRTNDGRENSELNVNVKLSTIIYFFRYVCSCHPDTASDNYSPLALYVISVCLCYLLANNDYCITWHRLFCRCTWTIDSIHSYTATVLSVFIRSHCAYYAVWSAIVIQSNPIQSSFVKYSCQNATETVWKINNVVCLYLSVTKSIWLNDTPTANVSEQGRGTDFTTSYPHTDHIPANFHPKILKFNFFSLSWTHEWHDHFVFVATNMVEFCYRGDH